MRPAQGRRSAAALENAPEHHVQDSFVLSPLFISHLSLDDVEEEIRVAAAAQEVSQTEGLVQGLHLILDLGWRSARWTPDHEQKQSCDEGKYIFSRKEASLVSYCGSRLVSWDSSRLLLSVMVCLVEAAARWLSKARISCFSRWEI